MQYVSADAPGLTRHKQGKAFRYVDAQGKSVRDDATLSRIRALAIPPAWTNVWICADAKGHLQATGRDARARKQYRYHTQWREQRDEAKYHRLVDFCRALPKVRAAVERDLACSCLCKRKVIATVVALMERAQMRVGNDEYAKANGSYGATTLQDRHAKFHGDTLELAYRAKGGIDRRVKVTNRRLARIVRQCRDVPGQRLFQYFDGDRIGAVTSNDVNEYLHEVSDGPFTAKDYRTWAATLGAAMLLCAIEHPGSDRKSKACVKEVIVAVATKLGHTPTICRKSYIHPRVIDDFSSGTLERQLARQMKRRVKDVAIDASSIDVDSLRAVEPVVARYLDSAVRNQRRA
ncbi:DNA topoisomerase IB [soil metagenome]